MRISPRRLLCTLTAVGVLGTSFVGCKVTIGKPKSEPVPAPAPAPPPPPSPAPLAPKLSQKMTFKVNDRGEVELPGHIRFKTATATLLPESDEILDIVHQYLTAKPTVTKLRIEGHTDTDGDDASNFDLSKRRAMAVVGWLVAKGIDCKRLIPVGFGEKRLLVTPDDTSEAKAENRRVMFVNAEVDGKPVGGLPVDGGEPGQMAGDPCK